MINGIFSTFTGKAAAERGLEMVANNLANALTAGFKASKPVYNGSNIEGEVEADQLQQTYVNIPYTYVHFSDGPLLQTGSSLDLAIQGKGFFVVSTPKGDIYTRDGQFTLNSDKKLVTMDGNTVTGQSGGEITIDGKKIEIGADGSIFSDGSMIDKLKIVDFTDKKSLKNFGSSLFVNEDPENTETTAQGYSIKQGYYEASNVDSVKEMVNMISAMRAFEAYTKADQAVDDSLGKLMDTVKL